ncbi:hypothetical protein [Pseudomonas syringae group genomosp. 3]|uniref:hypothetical protein n=1 Tax=Pseudomonas syringae group genomosp. 3 TaxID=251701 RepID=UPI0006B8B16C|nr:hypothetical protein [Pseudomonas syringae group genomosp. 3]
MTALKRLTKQINKNSEGEYDHKAWLLEGDKLLISSGILRDTFTENKKHLETALKNDAPEVHSLIPIDISLPSTSILLIGYAVEMYLKSALAQIFIGCSEQIFKITAKRLSHNLLHLCQYVYFPIDKQTQADLVALQASILEEARYPVSLKSGEDHYQKHSNRTSRQYDQENYNRYCELAKSLKKHAEKLRGSHDDVVCSSTWTILNDGYITMRCGGGVPGRVTFRLSREMESTLDPLQELESMIRATSPHLAAAWDDFEIYEEVVEVTVSLKQLKKK